MQLARKRRGSFGVNERPARHSQSLTASPRLQRLQIEISGAKLVASGWFAILAGVLILLAALILPVMPQLFT